MFKIFATFYLSLTSQIHEIHMCCKNACLGPSKGGELGGLCERPKGVVAPLAHPHHEGEHQGEQQEVTLVLLTRLQLVNPDHEQQGGSVSTPHAWKFREKKHKLGYLIDWLILRVYLLDSKRKEKGRRKASRKITRLTKSGNFTIWKPAGRYLGIVGYEQEKIKMWKKSGEGFQGHIFWAYR